VFLNVTIREWLYVGTGTPVPTEVQLICALGHAIGFFLGSVGRGFAGGGAGLEITDGFV
jgi:hypothetical protein